MTVRTYLVIFAILVGSTAGEVNLIHSGLSAALVSTIILLLAGFKAGLVALFFQHLKDEPKALSSLMLLALLAIIPLLTLSFLQIHPFH